MPADAWRDLASKRAVVIIDSKSRYTLPPCHPSERYPEIAGLPHADLGPENRVYAMVREGLHELGLDPDRYGTADWNPFVELIRPGQRVLLKPNLVLHFNGESEDLTALVTQAAVLRPIIDYAWKALGGRGEIVVGDSPHGNADFAKTAQASGVAALVDFLLKSGVAIRLVDFRKYVYPPGPSGFERGIFVENEPDPDGYVLVDLGAASALEDLPHPERLYGADYDRAFIRRQHHPGTHRYLVSGTVLRSDVVISVPKMKVHKKTGVTLNLKNLVGINGDKNFLPHYRIGSTSEGGDEYPDLASAYWRGRFHLHRFLCDRLLAPNVQAGRRVYGVLARVLDRLDRTMTRFAGPQRRFRSGDWIGNDTCWRTTLDLYRILAFADASGQMHDRPQRSLFSIVDGIVGGENEGPMRPDPKQVGAIVCGAAPILVDALAAWSMGFDLSRLKVVHESLARLHGLRCDDLDRQDFRVRIDGAERPFREVNLRFRPHPEWLEAAR